MRKAKSLLALVLAMLTLLAFLPTALADETAHAVKLTHGEHVSLKAEAPTTTTAGADLVIEYKSDHAEFVPDKPTVTIGGNSYTGYNLTEVDADGYRKLTISNEALTGDVTIHLTASGKMYPVKFISEEGTTNMPGDATAAYGSTYTLPQNVPARTGKAFKGWKAVNGGTYQPGGTYTSIPSGGAFKPRTSPYDFQGLKGEGIRLLLEAKKATGLPIVTEIMNANYLDLFEDVDIIQVGARNMQNFDLLKELGRTNKPILLKRGLANTLKELLMSAEYIMSEGNQNIILCERGIRTFDTYSRNTLDLTAVPMLHELSHLPVIVDPSHATGKVRLVPPMALAAVACGADGVMVEVHNDPMHALCDGAQSLKPEQFADLAKRMRRVREALV